MKVIVYTKPGCMQCRATKALMDRLGIKHELVDISNKPGIIERFVREGHKNLPVVAAYKDYESIVWNGFRPDLIKQL